MKEFYVKPHILPSSIKRMFRTFLLPILTLLVALPEPTAAQLCLPAALPDSITVQDNAWNISWSNSDSYTLMREEGGYTVFRNFSSYSRGRRSTRSTEKEQVGYVTERDIRGLIREVTDTGFSSLRLRDLGVDSGWISDHAEKLFSAIRRKYDFWTARQIAFAKKELRNYSNYDAAARRAIFREGYYYIAKDFSVNFRLQFYRAGDTVLTATASENYLGLPWQVGDHVSYNRGISKSISSLLPAGNFGNLKRLRGEHLMTLLADQLYDDNIRDALPGLAVLEYADYSNQLKKDFMLLGASEASLEWLEFKKWPQTFRFTLRHPSLHPGVQLQFYVARMGNSLYPIDSLRHAFPLLRDRIEHVKILMDYLDSNPSRKINLFFFDHLAISLRHIDDFNKDSTHWKMHDSWVKDMEMYKTGTIKPSFDIAESIETSKRVECGCNFRLDNQWLRQSMLFEVRDEFGNSSTWVLLPDNTPVLWYFQGETVYKYSYKDLGTNGRSVQYPCMKLDTYGNLTGANGDRH
jgi:hypothetical protein